MKLYSIGLTIAAIAGGLSCASSNSTVPQEERTTLVSKPAPVKQGETKGTVSVPGPTIPKDAQWTILCATITGLDHAGQARTARTNLISSTKMPDWYTVSGEGQTTLYYGFYRSINDPKDA